MKHMLKAAVLTLAVLAAVFMFLYISGLSAQLLINYAAWESTGGIYGQAEIQAVTLSPLRCFRSVFSIQGLKSMAFLLIAGTGLYLYVKFHDRFEGGSTDPRGFTISKQGTYGTASWMSDKEMRQVLEVRPIPQAEGIILGEKDGKAVCLPVDTRLNRHVAICGSSGTMKSRAIIRPALFNLIRRGESAIITDPKGEMYGDTAELFRKNGYEVRVRSALPQRLAFMFARNRILPPVLSTRRRMVRHLKSAWTFKLRVLPRRRLSLLASAPTRHVLFLT